MPPTESTPCVEDAIRTGKDAGLSHRFQAMVCGPASSPASSFRSPVISSTVSRLIADGEVFGRRDRGSNAASPSAS